MSSDKEIFNSRTYEKSNKLVIDLSSPLNYEDFISIVRYCDDVNKLYIKNTNEEYYIPLLSSCSETDPLSWMMELLGLGADPNLVDTNGYPALRYAIDSRDQDSRRVTTLIDYGADVNKKGYQSFGGVSPLMSAINNGNFSMVKILVDNGANVNDCDAFGQSVISYVRSGDCFFKGIACDVAVLLLKNGSKIEDLYKSGCVFQYHKTDGSSVTIPLNMYKKSILSSPNISLVHILDN